MKKFPLIQLGISIVHFGDKSRTVRCLNSFIRATLWLKRRMPTVKTSILIVDNSGNLNLQRDRSCPHGIEIRYFGLRRNLGYAGACCIATKLLKNASILVFSNNDITLREDALLRLLETLRSLPDVGAIQPLTLDESSRVDSIGLTYNGIMYAFSYSYWPIKPLSTFTLKKGLKVMECFGIDGMLFMLKKKVWEEIGGWDPEYFMFNEAGLLSWKLRLRGYKNYVALSSIVYHKRGSTAKGRFLKEDPIFSSFYTSRNRILSVLYIHEGIWLIIYFFTCILFEFVKNFILSLKNRSSLNLYHYFRALIFILNYHKHITFERAKVFRKFGARYFLRQGYILPLLTSFIWLFNRRKSILE